MDKGLLIGGDVEIGREDPIGRGWDKLDGGLLDDLSAVLAQASDNVIHGFRRGAKDVNTRVAGVVALLADFDLADSEGAAVRQDFIEDLRKNERVNDVAAQFD